MTEKNNSGNYEVGNKKPPKHSQFQPGESGNLNGRPKGSKNKKEGKYTQNLEKLILKEAYREVELLDNGRKIKIPIVQAATRAQLVKAAKGDTRASIHLQKTVSEIEHKKGEREQEFLENVIAYKTQWAEEKRRSQILGLPLPDLPIDPDLIFIEPDTDEVKIGRYQTEEEREFSARMNAMKAEQKVEIRHMESSIKNTDDVETLNKLKTRLKRFKKFVALVEKLIPE